MMDQKQKSNIIGVAIMIAIFLGYSYYMQIKYPPGEHAAETGSSGENNQNASPEHQEASAPGSLESGPNSDVNAAGKDIPSGQTEANGLGNEEKWQSLPERDLLFQGALSEFSLSQQVPNFRKIILKDYFEEKEHRNPVNLVFNGFTFLAQLGDAYKYDQRMNRPLAAKRNATSLEFSHTEDNFKIEESFAPNTENYGGTLNTTFINQSSISQDLVGGMAWTVDVPFQESQGSSFLTGMVLHPRITYRVNEKTKFIDIHKVCIDPKEERPNFKGVELDFIGIDEHYFLRAIMPKNKMVNVTTYMQPLSGDAGCRLTMIVSQSLGVVSSGGSASLEFSTYFGPKSADIIVAHDKNLYHTLDMGIFDFIAQPLYSVIKYFYGLVGNYGIAIIILTMILKILFFPLQRQATYSMQRMKVLQPQMNQIRERFKEDSRRQQQELMKFMVANKVNPMKGCLPVLPQIPVFFAFYRVLSTAMELRHAPFFGWIADLSVKDPYYITPLVLGALMFFQQKLTPTTGMDKNQEKIMMFMPVIFTVMMLSLPSGMVIYMITNTAISILQSYWLNKRFATTAVAQ